MTRLLVVLTALLTGWGNSKIVGILERVKGVVTVHKIGESSRVPLLPCAITSDMEVSIAKGATAYVWDGQRVMAFKGPKWPDAPSPQPTVLESLFPSVSALATERKNYVLTGIRGSEQILTKPVLVASNALTRKQGQRFVVLFAVSKDKAPLVRISLLSDDLFSASVPRIIHSYEDNTIYTFEITGSQGTPVVGIDCGIIRGEAIALKADADHFAPELETLDSVEGRLAQADCLASKKLDASAIIYAYSAGDIASTPEEIRQVDEELWTLLRRVGSPLADFHLPKVKGGPS